MADREKVIKGLECCLANGHNNCPYKSTDEGIDKVTSCTTYLMKDALALLKAQEPVEMKWRNGYAYCGQCGYKLHWIVDLNNFCPNCGRAVKWYG